MTAALEHMTKADVYDSAMIASIVKTYGAKALSEELDFTCESRGLCLHSPVLTMS